MMGFALLACVVSSGSFWEFICDSVGGMNLQRYALDGTPSGREALMDTMGDLTNTIGAALMGVSVCARSRQTSC